ncbi:MAG: CpsD/CapB family tyrosine-protein kinase [Firmicutes bacterium]|nr:CpsD/CapB family tyrosine-protein kinase [Bacillota bacterium]
MSMAKRFNFSRRKANQFDLNEVYRQLRTNIEFMEFDDKVQAINITSTTKNEGKTTISLNLARMFAAKYQGVLLIDCDLRNPSIHKQINKSNSQGLSNILSELSENLNISYREEVFHLQFAPEENPFDVITTGTKVPNPTEVLSSNRFRKFMEIARQQYKYIIIDCPPIGYVADAIPVSNLCDGTLYVISCKEKHKKQVRNAVNDLKRTGVNILGAVLNKVDISSQKYGYGYYYGDEK